ncbi:hypothetical protein D3C71_1890200 [compost metagenome]
MRLIFRSESPIDTPNLPTRLLASIVMPAMETLAGSLLLDASIVSVSITPRPVTPCRERSNSPVKTMPLKSTEVPSCVILTGAILDVELVMPL